jgi:membrane protein
MILLLWVYYSCQILLLGAEFTRVYADRHGVAPQPEAFAEPDLVAIVADEALEQERLEESVQATADDPKKEIGR